MELSKELRTTAHLLLKAAKGLDKLGGTFGNTRTQTSRRSISASGRKRIVAAQQRRWKVYRSGGGVKKKAA